MELPADQNARGRRRFVEVTSNAGLTTGHFWGTGAAWADFDGDGFADLYVCQYVDWSWQNNPVCQGFHHSIKRDVCVPRHFKAHPHLLFRNDGNGHFTDVTASAGLRSQRRDEDYGKALGVVAVDLNGDRKPDIYIANETSGNLLYLNRSRPGCLAFDNVGNELGVATDDAGIASGSMGNDAGDPFGTGWPAPTSAAWSAPG